MLPGAAPCRVRISAATRARKTAENGVFDLGLHPSRVRLPALSMVRDPWKCGQPGQPLSMSELRNCDDCRWTRGAVRVASEDPGLFRLNLGFGDRLAPAFLVQPALEPAVHGFPHGTVVVMAGVDHDMADSLLVAHLPEPLAA